MIERETTKHGPGRDEDLKRNVGPILHGAPVESRSRENRVQGPDDERLRGLPAHGRFENLERIWVALGHAAESRTSDRRGAPPARSG